MFLLRSIISNFIVEYVFILVEHAIFWKGSGPGRVGAGPATEEPVDGGGAANSLTNSLFH